MMMKSSKREEGQATIRQPNMSIGSPSPKKRHIARDNTCTNFRRDKPLVQLPKIYPLNLSLKHKRYLESISNHQEGFLNLVGTKFYRKHSREHRRRQDSISTADLKRDRLLLDKQESPKQSFLQTILASNGIAKLIHVKKEKIKIFVDEGNNSRLVNELMRRRVNVKMIDNREEANIVWTQNCDWEISNRGSIFTQSVRGQRDGTSFRTEALENSTFDHQLGQCDTRAKPRKLKDILITKLSIHNHLKHHFQISDKKCLFKNIKKYCKINKLNQNDIIPMTYHLENGSMQLPQQVGDGKMWIVKPGEDTNRGKGISVQMGRENVMKAVRELAAIGKSSLVQQYIDPLLYKNRKFDIRCYALVTSYCGQLKAYWYKEGYLRTCCKQFSYDPSNLYGHLTNDAVQKKHKDYGKYEQCNKLSYNDLEVLLKTKEISYEGTLHKMKQLARTSIRAAEEKLKGDKNIFAFEIYGYDYLIDSKGKVWLIEINTNPCLQFAGSLLSRIIWHMTQNSLAIAIDPFLLDLPENYNTWREKMDKIYEQSKFQCII